jgi:hypothetical protein
MAAGAGGTGGTPGPNAGKELPQHPLVESLKPDPSQPAKKSTVLTGLPGKSDRPGYQRLYLTTRLDYYAEFLTRDVLGAQVIPADRSPFPGQEATQVTIGRDSTIYYILARSAQPVDEFDLDVRLGAPGAMAAVLPLPTNTCPGGVCETRLTFCDTCPRTQCETCPPTRCNTCHTHCNQATCGVQHTCVNTQCNQATCGAQQTCVNTQCNQVTCVNTQCNQHTCVNTQCNQATCPGGQTCGGQTCVFTQCNQHTCGQQTCGLTQCNHHTCAVNTCDDTCFRTCVTCIHPHCPLPQ